MTRETTLGLVVAGSFLEGAPIVAVSSTTGAGLDDLRRELATAATAAAEKDAGGRFTSMSPTARWRIKRAACR